MKMQDFTRKIRVSGGYLVVTVTYKNGRLSLVGNGYRGPARGCGGQHADYLMDISKNYLTDNWTHKKLRVLYKVWKRYHLNDMKVGNRRQELFLRRMKKRGWVYTSYEAACELLKKYNLYEDCGYKYGHAWKSEPVPECILHWLRYYDFEKSPSSLAPVPQ